jgi:hypothetical protein
MMVKVGLETPAVTKTGQGQGQGEGQGHPQIGRGQGHPQIRFPRQSYQHFPYIPIIGPPQH